MGKPRIPFSKVGNGNHRQRYSNTWNLTGQPSLRKKETEESIVTELRKITEHLQYEKVASEMKEEWHYTMEVFDRLFFVIFLLICVGFACYIFSFELDKGNQWCIQSVA